MDISQLEQIYSTYEKDLAEANRKSSVFAGIFGQGTMNDSRSDPCNQAFYEQTGRWVHAFAVSAPGEKETEQACRWILDAAARNKGKQVYWYYLVAQSYVKELLPLLSPECRAVLAADFNRQYPKRIRLPIQEELYRCMISQKK